MFIFIYLVTVKLRPRGHVKRSIDPRGAQNNHVSRGRPYQIMRTPPEIKRTRGYP